MKACFINSAISISAQDSLIENGIFNQPIFYSENVIKAVPPNYKEYISGGAARRMAPGVKMGVVASKLALDNANLVMPDAIITGTGMGCVRDSEKFVSALIDNGEEFLTPTSFIQSTHNTVGAQIALGLGCKGYNFTYVHSVNSFESSLIDAQMMLDEKAAKQVLVGGIDEHGSHTNSLHKLIGHIKDETVNSKELLSSTTKGTIFGEGASFFVLGSEKVKSTAAELVACDIYSRRTKDQLQDTIQNFLNQNTIGMEEIDAVLLGNNGDHEFDGYYSSLQEGIFKHTPQIAYKHLSGEFMTASAFGFWLGVKIIKNKKIPEACKLNSIAPKQIKNLLLYNQYRGENHSLTLLRSV